MALQLSEDQVLALSPDDASSKAGRDLASSSNWSNTGCNEFALWGECKGSGKNPYKTQVDISSIAFKCSCPSRKFPCKHGLGLLLLYTGNKDLFKTSTPPAWVQEWMDKRKEKAEKVVETEDKPADEQARAKRQEQRLKKVNGGIAELHLVLSDLIRNGILNMPEKGPALFAALTKRMVDAQASGLAAMTRQLSEMNYFEESWQTVFMDHFLRIYMAISGFEKAEILPDKLRDEVKGLIGFTQSPDDLKQQQGISDSWLVLGKRVEQQEQLFIQRNWLFGTKTKQYALILQFYVRSQLPELNLVPGTVVDAEMCFYKGQLPYRAMIKNMGDTKSPDHVDGFGRWAEFQQYEKNIYIQSPFATEMPALINKVRLSRSGNGWFMKDEDQISMPLQCKEEQLYGILAVSGGAEFSVAIVSSGGNHEPLGLFSNGKYYMV